MLNLSSLQLILGEPQQLSFLSKSTCYLPDGGQDQSQHPHLGLGKHINMPRQGFKTDPNPWNSSKTRTIFHVTTVFCLEPTSNPCFGVFTTSWRTSGASKDPKQGLHGPQITNGRQCRDVWYPQHKASMDYCTSMTSHQHLHCCTPGNHPTTHEWEPYGLMLLLYKILGPQPFHQVCNQTKAEARQFYDWDGASTGTLVDPL